MEQNELIYAISQQGYKNSYSTGRWIIFKCPVLLQTVMGDRVSSADGSDDLDELPDITDSDLVEMRYIEQIFDEASR